MIIMARKIETDIKIFSTFKYILGLEHLGISHVKYGKIDIIVRRLYYLVYG